MYICHVCIFIVARGQNSRLIISTTSWYSLKTASCSHNRTSINNLRFWPKYDIYSYWINHVKQIATAAAPNCTSAIARKVTPDRLHHISLERSTSQLCPIKQQLFQILFKKRQHSRPSAVSPTFSSHSSRSLKSSQLIHKTKRHRQQQQQWHDILIYIV